MWVLLEIADGIVERFDALGLLVDELHEGIHLTVGYLRRNAREGIIDQMILWEIVCQELAQLGGGAMKEDEAYRCDLLHFAHGRVLLDRLDGLMDEVTRNEDGIRTDTGFCQDRFHLIGESGYLQRMTVDISPGRVVIGFLYHRFSAFSLDSKPSRVSVLMMNITWMESKVFHWFMIKTLELCSVYSRHHFISSKVTATAAPFRAVLY